MGALRRTLARAAVGSCLTLSISVTVAWAQAEAAVGTLGDLRRQRNVVLEYLDAVPDSVLSFRPTSGVRSYREQLEHIALAADLLSAAVAGSISAGSMDPGSCGCLSSRAALRAFIDGAFDRAVERLRSTSPGDLSATLEFFRISRTRLDWYRWIQEHTAWTLGQVVPYLRLNGIAPPAYLPL